MKKNILCLFICICLYPLQAQISYGGTPPSMTKGKQRMASDIPKLTLPPVEFEAPQNDSVQPFSIGKIINVEVDLVKESSRYSIDSNLSLLQFKIIAPKAQSIGLYFQRFHLPESARMFIYSPNYKEIIGAFTSASNRSHFLFATQSVKGEEITIEIEVRNSEIDSLEALIGSISPLSFDQSERDQFDPNTDLPIDNSCFNNDVNCNDYLKNQRRAVVHWQYSKINETGTKSCSGILINQNVSADKLRYYILTAEHCACDAILETAIFYFNYQKPICQGYEASTNYTTMGASIKASRKLYDMCLLELAETPPEHYNVHFAGWDRSEYSDLSENVTTIHHPKKFPKKCSRGHFAENSNLYFWRTRWDQAITGGSSGAPLIEERYGRVIGTLYTGFFDCSDWSGISKSSKLRQAWTGPSKGGRLQDWLDPDGNDKNAIDGRDPSFTNVVLNKGAKDNSAGNNKEIRLNSALNYQDRNNIIIQASESLSTGNIPVIITKDADYTFRAGNKIVLNPGFKVEAGAVFKTQIAPPSTLKYP